MRKRNEKVRKKSEWDETENYTYKLKRQEKQKQPTKRTKETVWGDLLPPIEIFQPMACIDSKTRELHSPRHHSTIEDSHNVQNTAKVEVYIHKMFKLYIVLPLLKENWPTL